MKLKLTSLTLFVFITIASLAQNYYGVTSPESSPSPKIQLIDVTNGNVISATSVTMSGSTVNGSTGMALNPIDQKLYVIIKSGSIFKLATISPTTGVATFLTDLDNSFAGIAFGNTGILYGITGDGAINPSRLSTINLTTGVSSMIMNLDKESDGETIAFNSKNGLIYRFAGDGIFESINPINKVVTKLDTFSYVSDWAHSLFYNPVSDKFIFTAGDSIYEYVPSVSLTFLSYEPSATGYKGIVLQSLIADIEDASAKIGITVSPNPATDIVNIEMEKSFSNAEVRVRDIQGRVVYFVSLENQKSLSIPVENLSSGIYFINIAADGSQFNKKFYKH